MLSTFPVIITTIDVTVFDVPSKNCLKVLKPMTKGIDTKLMRK